MVEILFQDENFIAVNKPIDVNSIAGRNEQNEVVLLKMVEEIAGQKLYVVHRLDKQVSGVMVFAKTATSHKYLNDLFFKGEVTKQYLALVYGVLKSDEEIIDKPIREYGSGRMAVDFRQGKKSLTICQVKKRYKQYTLVDIYPKTGRRHQIRVHLYSLGHPIVGDLQYGDKTEATKYPRLMLHSEKITFLDPNNQEITISAPTPELFNRIIDKIK